MVLNIVLNFNTKVVPGPRVPAGCLVSGGMGKEVFWNKMENLCGDKVGKDVTLSVKCEKLFSIRSQ